MSAWTDKVYFLCSFSWKCWQDFTREDQKHFRSSSEMPWLSFKAHRNTVVVLLISKLKLSTHNLFVSINYLHLDELRFKSDDAGALEAVHFLGHFCLLLHWRCTNGLNLGRSHGQLRKNIHLLLRLLKFFLKRRKRNNRSLKYQLSFFKNLS